MCNLQCLVSFQSLTAESQAVTNFLQSPAIFILFCQPHTSSMSYFKKQIVDGGFDEGGTPECLIFTASITVWVVHGKNITKISFVHMFVPDDTNVCEE